MVLISPDFLERYQPRAENEYTQLVQRAVTTAMLEIAEGVIAGTYDISLIQQVATDGSGSAYNQAAFHLHHEMQMNQGSGNLHDIEEVRKKIAEIRANNDLA